MVSVRPIQLNAFALVLYGVVHWASLYQNLPLISEILGLFILLGLVPYNILKIARVRFRSYLEQILAWLSIYLFLFAPLMLVLHWGLAISLTLQNIAIVIGFILFASGLLVRSEVVLIRFPTKQTLVGLLGRIWPLLIVFLAFCLLHGTTYHFYGFIPESDSYVDLININSLIQFSQDQMIEGRKPGFYVAVLMLTSVADIDPYILFSVGIVFAQASLIGVVWLLIQRFKVTDRMMQLGLLMSTLAVPVLTLEIDIVRAQSFYVIAFPIWTYFLFQALVTRHLGSWLVAGVISVGGLLYHEFFLFLTIVFSYAVAYRLGQFWVRHADRKDRCIIILSLALVVAVFMSTGVGVRPVTFAQDFLASTWGRVSQVSQWQWWFLDSYGTGQSGDVGWQGVKQVAQYYGYYLSPLIAAAVLGLIVWWRRLVARQQARMLGVILGPLLVVFLSFAEVLPRLNAAYLPERFWLLFDLCVLLLLVPLVRTLARQYVWRTVVLGLWAVLILTGIGGSLYIAQGKGSLISPSEYQAALWINANTPASAAIISQEKNRAIIEYFAGRTMVVPTPNFFLSDQVEHLDFSGARKLLVEEKSAAEQQGKEIFTRYLLNEQSFDGFSSEIQLIKQLVARRAQQLARLEALENTPLYAMYSYDKFATLYSQRSWWREANFYGANLDKFQGVFPLVYDDGRVKIWHIQQEGR